MDGEHAATFTRIRNRARNVCCYISVCLYYDVKMKDANFTCFGIACGQLSGGVWLSGTAKLSFPHVVKAK